MKTTPSTASRTAVTVLLMVALAVTLWASTSSSARAETSISDLTVTGKLSADGVLTVTETYTVEGTLPDTFTKRFATRENGVGDVQYVQELSDVTATVAGQPAEVTLDVQQDHTNIDVATAGGAGPLTLSYTVRGAVRDEGDSHVFQYRVLQGLQFAVQRVTATVEAPAVAQGIRCYAGAPNSTSACRMAAQGTHDNPHPTWVDGPRGPGEQVTAIAPYAPEDVAASAIVDHRWSLGRAFGAGPAELLSALAVLLIGGLVLWTLHRRAGRDAHHGDKVEKVGEFVPVGDGESEFQHFGAVRPGHVGTVSDERVDPIDVTATILDLAVRGHLRITELPREREFAQADWQLTRREGTDELAKYEAELLDAVAPVGEGERVSHLAERVPAKVADLQDALYDEVVAQGWYDRRPDETRNSWLTYALVALVVAVVGTGLLVAFTTFGLLGLALVAVALGLVFVAQEMPARTTAGAALLQGLGRLSHELHNHSTSEMPKGRELHELSEVLPYAVVLGGADRWLDALVAADGDDDPDSTDLDWYHGPENWHLRDLPDSLRNFITTVSGTLFSR
ncbi:DUF2207 domain-containing protein [Propionibacteriaceae bacterium Y2011]